MAKQMENLSPGRTSPYPKKGKKKPKKKEIEDIKKERARKQALVMNANYGEPMGPRTEAQNKKIEEDIDKLLKPRKKKK